MSPSIILQTRSSCKCGVLFEGYPSAINNRQVPCLSSLSIHLRGHLGRVQGKEKYGMCTSKEAALHRQCNFELNEQILLKKNTSQTVCRLSRQCNYNYKSFCGNSVQIQRTTLILKKVGTLSNQFKQT